MNPHRYAGVATRLLKSALRGSSLDIGDRARGVAAVEHALRRRVRRRQLARGLILGAAASLAIATGFILRRGPDPALEAGDEIRGGRDGAQVTLSTGTRLFVGAEGRLELLALGPQARLALRAGRVRADVARLRAGERFVLETTDAEVEVRGTSFEVSVVPQPGCPSGSTTRVEVLEGTVQVRSGHEPAAQTTTLGPGTSWLNTCVRSAGQERVAPRPEPSAPPPRPMASRSPAARVSPEPRRSSTRTPPAAVALPAPSTLAAENDLFEAALLAERTGDVSAALRHLDELLVRFPHGSLAGPAREQRLRLARRPTTSEAP